MERVNEKIFGIGLPRTGTTSLVRALEEYGVDAVHFPFELYEDGIQAPVIDEHTAFVDTPIPLMYKELDKQWPQSKFVLTVRNKEDWLESMSWLWEEGRRLWQIRPTYYEYDEAFFGTDAFDEVLLSKRFDDYHREVETYFEGRNGDLLTINLIDSPDTTKLVDFLDLDGQPKPWPEANSARKSGWMQELAYQFEKHRYMKVGNFIRRVGAGIQRRWLQGNT